MPPSCRAISLAFFLALSASVAPASAQDARALQAQALAHQGDAAGAEALWHQIAAEAPQRGDVQALDQARHALAAIAFQRGRYEEFTALQNQRLEDAAARGDVRVQADAWMELALLERRRGHLDSARAGLEKAVEVLHRAADRDGEGVALNHLGLVLLNQGLYTQALEALEDAQALHRAGADVQLDRTLQYLGLLYHGLRDYEEARLHLERGLALAEQSPDPMRAAPLLGSLARVANDAGRYEAALEYTTRSHELAVRFHSAPGRAYSLLERARALRGLDRLEEARETAEAARDLSRSLTQERTAADATFVLGQLALRKGDTAQALRLFNEAIPNYRAASDVPQMLDAYRQMIPVLRRQGDVEEAARLAELALAMQEQISGRDISRRIALLEYRHQSADNARHIQLLQRENEIQQLRLAHQAQDRRIGLGLILGLGIITAVLAWAFARSRRARAALAVGNRELEASRHALAHAHAALAERAQVLGQAAITDPLTGIPNRSHVLDTLEHMAATAHAQQQGLAVMMLDVDFFKNINDRHGHVIGDRVLRRVALLTQKLLPPQAMLGRYGGEEFLLALPGHELDAARKLAERIRHAVAESIAPDEPSVTLSIGVAARMGGHEIDPDALIEEADRALYRAKDLGRNRVETALRVA